MARISKKKREDREQQALITSWRARGSDPNEAVRLGIMAGLFPEKLNEIQKQEAKLEAAAAKHFDELGELQAEAVRMWKADGKSAIVLGKILLKVQEKMANMPRGAFQSWWMKEGLEKNRVYYCMRLVAPKGNKVKESKERRARTPRAVAFSLVNDKLTKLWKAAEENNTAKANEILDELVKEIKARFIANPKKEALKAMAASA